MAGTLQNALKVIFLIVALSVQPIVELGLITLLRQGSFPPWWIAAVIVVLHLIAFVLDQVAGSLRGYYLAMEYGDHERAEKVYGPSMRRYSRGACLFQVAHLVVFLGLLIQSLVQRLSAT